MTKREALIAEIREVLAEDPQITAIVVPHDYAEWLHLDHIDGVDIVYDLDYDGLTSGTVH